MKVTTMVALAMVFLGPTFVHGADWPQWRGVRRDGFSADAGLQKEWTSAGPKLRWKAEEIGTGYSSPVVVDGRVYLQTTHDNEEFALALDEQAGATLWSVKIGTVGKNRGPNFPGTRSTPSVDGEFIYCLASGGELTCLARADGQTRWQRNLKDDFGGAVGNWAYAESVLVDGNAVVCTPGGSRATVVKLNKLNGETIWESAVPGDDAAGYASIMKIDGDGGSQYVQFLHKGLVGLDAESGRFLWRYEKTADEAANIITPVVSGNQVFTGSRSGGATVRVDVAGGKMTTEELYFDQSLSPGIGGAVLVDGFLYGTSGEVLICADFKTGEIKWRNRSVGAASVCYADGRLYVRGHNSGEVALVEATPQEYIERGRLVQESRSETKAWPHPVVANGGLYLRDENTLLCYDVGQK